jgi:hypothetical protein
MLMEECVRMMQQTLRASPSIKKRAKSVYSQRNLGTIKDRKREKKEEKEVSNGETIMRILRMRYVVFPSFLVLVVTNVAQAEYVGFYRTATADRGNDASRTGKSRSPATETEGPETGGRRSHSGCAIGSRGPARIERRHYFFTIMTHSPCFPSSG